MAHGKPKGKITTAFRKRIEELEKRAREFSEQFRRFNEARKWHTPENMKEKNLLDVAGLHEPAWNRDEANRIYSQDVLSESSDRGTTGDLIALKKQIDFMAVEERAFRMRHASFIRCAAMAHGRLDGHGLQDKGIFSMLKNSIDNDLLRGSDPGAFDGFTGDIGGGASAQV
jgi:hypothetical protein